MGDDGRSRPTSGRAAVSKLKNALQGLAEVRAPEEAQEPILAPMIRVALAQWLVELRNADALASVGVKPRSSALLYGPPGTGKTTFAHHLAARLGYPMVSVGAENIVSKYVGESQQNAAKLFEALAAVAVPCMLFIDEIDAIGGARESAGNDSAGSETKSMLTVFLRKIEEYKGLILGATNRRDAIDKALWRRFSMHLCVDLPQVDERWAILKRYSLPFQISDIVLDTLADLTDQASPALLEALMVGMKRSLVLGPKMKLRTDSPGRTLMPIIASLEPPPGISEIPLWKEPGVLDAIIPSGHWPPKLAEAEAA